MAGRESEYEVLLGNDEMIISQLRNKAEDFVRTIGRHTHNILKLTKKILETHHFPQKKKSLSDICNKYKLEDWLMNFDALTKKIEATFMESVLDLRAILTPAHYMSLKNSLHERQGSLSENLEFTPPILKEEIRFLFHFIRFSNDFTDGISEISKRPDGGMHVISKNISKTITQPIVSVEEGKLKLAPIKYEVQIFDLKKLPGTTLEKIQQPLELTCIDSINKNSLFIGTQKGEILKIEMEENDTVRNVEIMHSILI